MSFGRTGRPCPPRARAGGISYMKVYNPNTGWRILEESTKDIVGVNINLDELNLKKLPSFLNKIKKVYGFFACSNNYLTNLKNCPISVENNFYCSFNLLTSLVGSPSFVGEDFYCQNNKLPNLLGRPEGIVRIFVCNYNLLTTLVGGPKVVRTFRCTNNLLTSLVGAPKCAVFDCWGNPGNFSYEEVLMVTKAGVSLLHRWQSDYEYRN